MYVRTYLTLFLVYVLYWEQNLEIMLINVFINKIRHIKKNDKTHR